MGGQIRTVREESRIDEKEGDENRHPCCSESRVHHCIRNPWNRLHPEKQSFSGIPSRKASYTEPDGQYVPVLDDVILPFQTKFAFVMNFLFGTAGNQVFV